MLNSRSESRARNTFGRAAVVALAMSASLGCGQASARPPVLFAEVVNESYQRLKANNAGATADYIPELSQVPADLFGVALMTATGETYSVGDVDYAFTIQSVSKPFTAALVMQDRGAEAIVEKIGVEPTGMPFNSVLATQLETPTGNPLVNAGAIATVSLVAADNTQLRFQKIQTFFKRLAGSPLALNEAVYASETKNNQLNRAHAYLLFKNKRIYSDPLDALDVYTRQCSLAVTTRQLAVMGATLANGGVNPLTKERVLEARYVPKVLALMMMAGFYDESGQWAYSTGLPAKSGVGGGVLAVVPGRYAIVGFSPRINTAGNSVRGALAVQYIAEHLGANVFSSAR